SVDVVHVEANEHGHSFTAAIRLSPLDPQQVQVELFAEGINSPMPTRILMEPQSSRTGHNGILLYQAEVDGSRNLAYYTIRLIPHHDHLAVPLEANMIYWQ